MSVAVGDLYLDAGEVDFTSASCFAMLNASDLVTMSLTAGAPMYSDVTTHPISVNGFLYSPTSGPVVL